MLYPRAKELGIKPSRFGVGPVFIFPFDEVAQLKVHPSSWVVQFNELDLGVLS